jgi:predicted nucleotidyltransferase
MKVLDFIIQNRIHIMSLVTKHGVISLKLYGSVLVRKETAESDIDFLAVFDSSFPNHWETKFKLQEELEEYFGRTVGILDSRSIPNVFRPAIDTDPVDIMDLSSSRNYTITPKTSNLYFTMLHKLFRKYYPVQMEYRETLYELLAEKISWWFSRLLRLEDNDLRDNNFFKYIEVLALCEKISAHSLEEYTNEELIRFEELLQNICEYVRLRFGG